MDVSSVSSYYYQSSPFFHPSKVMIRSLCKPKSLTHVEKDLRVSPNRSTSPSLQSSQTLPGLSFEDSSISANDDIIASGALRDGYGVACKSSDNPNAVLKLLSDYGFSKAQVETIVSKFPRILFCRVEETLKPKIDFLLSVGLSKTEFLGVVTVCPMLFGRSLKNHLVPIVEFLVTYFGSQDDAIFLIKKYPFILFNTSKHLVPNLSTLQNAGIPQAQISSMMATVIGGRVITCTKPSRFSKVVSTVMEIGFDPLSEGFKNAVIAMLFCRRSNWEEKLVFYETLGFSNKETLNMFMSNTSLISRSEEVIRGTVEFYVNTFHWSLSQLSKRTALLCYSLEKRIIPRCLVVQVLLSRKKIHKNVKLSSVLHFSENEFLRRYVIKYKNETPEVLEAYQGKMKSAERDFYWEELSRLPFKIIL